MQLANDIIRFHWDNYIAAYMLVVLLLYVNGSLVVDQSEIHNSRT